MTLPDHLESYLGPIDQGWNRGSFQIVKYSSQAPYESSSFSTLGLSRHKLKLLENTIRIELLILVKKTHFLETIPALLDQVVESILTSHKAPQRGDVIGPWGPILANSTAEAFYIMPPYYYKNEFGAYLDTESEPISIFWLTPITRKEARYVQTEGWIKFEAELGKIAPDLTDFYRNSCV